MRALLGTTALLVASPASPVAETAWSHRVDWGSPSVASHEPGRYFLFADLELPVRIARVEIPPDHRVRSVRLTPRVEIDGGLDQIQAHDVTSVKLPAARAGAAHGYRYWILDEGDLGGHRIAHVAICPVQREGARLLFLSSFDLHVVTEAGGTRALGRRVSHARTDRADAEQLARLLDADPLPPETFRLPRGVTPPELEAVTVEYVIITSQALAPVYEELAAIKTAEGTPARVTTVEWILGNYTGNDPAARIRAYIRDAYVYQGLRHVLLGGDTEQVPHRMATSYYAAPGGVQVVSDKYFACLDGDWNGDGDDQLGEPPAVGIEGDDADLIADVHVGRIPLSTPTEVAGWLAKWKAYTGYTTGPFRTDYQESMLSLGEVLFPADWDVGDDPEDITLDGAQFCEETLLEVPPSIGSVRLYEYATNPEYPGALPLLKADVIDRLNAGVGILDHVGHGYRSLWSVGDQNFTTQDADALTNAGAYPFAYAANCNSGAINFDCLMEHLLGNPTGGIVSGIASTEYDYPHAAEDFKREFFHNLFAQDRTAMGDAFYAAEALFAPIAEINEGVYRWTILTFIALGDPTLRIWRGTPRTLEVSFDASPVLGAGTLAATVTENGSPIEGARVTASKGDGFGVGVSDASGMVIVPFDPASPGSFQLTTTAEGYRPRVETGTVTASTPPVVRVESWVVHDGTAGGGEGNGDGRADAGESIVVAVTLKNDGGLPATLVEARLSVEAGAAVTVTDSLATAGELAPGAALDVPDAFAFEVASELPASLRHVSVEADLDVTAAEGEWPDRRTLVLYQRILDVTDLSWTITDDDGDGVLENGETVAIDLTVANRGEGAAAGVEAQATQVPAGFTILNDAVFFGTIPAGGSASAGSFLVRSDGGFAAGLALTAELVDGFSTSLLTRTLDLVAPSSPDSLDYQPTDVSVRVVWPPSTGADVRGYRVYRAEDAAGPYALVTPHAVEGGAFYADGGLAPLTERWYRVATVDSSGNESSLSDSLRAGTSPPALAGWPAPLPPGQTKGSPTIAHVDADGVPEVVLGWSYPMAFDAAGGDVVDGDGNDDTAGIFADIGGGASSFWNSPVVYDIDRDGVTELIFCAWQLPGQNYGWMYVLDATGAVEPGWPRQIGAWPWATPAVGNVDLDAELEIFVSSGAGWGPYQGALHGFNHDGTEVRDGDGNASTTGVFYKSTAFTAGWMYGSPALADLDNDGRDEIVFFEKTRHEDPTAGTLYAFDGDGSVLPGFPIGGPGVLSASTSSPAIADVDQDGDPEIVAVTQDLILVLHHDGTAVDGWPIALPRVETANPDIYDFLSSPAVGDVNGDGQLDIALGWLDGLVYLWNAADGTLHDGFPVVATGTGRLVERYMRSPVIGNVDGDPLPEIVVSNGYAELHAIKADASSVPGFPLKLAGTLYGSAALGDLDADGTTDLVAQTDAGELQVFALGIPYDATEHPWPAFRHDERKTGLYRVPSAVDVPDAAGAAPAPQVPAPRPNPFSPRVSLAFVVSERTAPVRIHVHDVAGRRVRALTDDTFPRGRHRVDWDGRDERGIQVSGGVYFARVEIGDRVFVRKLTRVR